MQHWQYKSWKAIILLPLSYLFGLLVFIRKLGYRLGLLRSSSSALPVVVVGNISVGGTGKTPLVGMLCEQLAAQGITPGIVSRGYGGTPQAEPVLVTQRSDASAIGDEPKLLHRDTGVDVCVCTNRVDAVKYLAENTACKVVLSDDGLQHYAMQRQLEIAVIDGQRGVGNGFLLPAGALREPISRLLSVDLIAVQIAQGDSFTNQITDIPGLQALHQKPLPPIGGFHLALSEAINLSDQSKHSLSNFKGRTVHAVAGIGNPTRFFNSLKVHGITVVEHALADHHSYKPVDIAFNDELPVLVTSKDAVKVQALQTDLSRVFEVTVSAKPNEQLQQALARLFLET